MSTDMWQNAVTLILEDNALIAMDAEMILHDCGATNTVITSTVDEAMMVIDARDTAPIGFALLDVHLHTGTSEAVAEALVSAGIPFVFASGDMAGEGMLARFPDVPLVTKPFSPASIKAVLPR